MSPGRLIWINPRVPAGDGAERLAVGRKWRQAAAIFSFSERNFFPAGALRHHSQVSAPGTSEMEHRCGTRFAHNRPVLIETALGVTAPATLCNVSASGALLKCLLSAPLYSRVNVRLPSAASAGWHSDTRVAAQIVRRSDEGFAIEWLEFSPPAVRHFLSLSTAPIGQAAHAFEEKQPPLTQAR